VNNIYMNCTKQFHKKTDWSQNLRYLYRLLYIPSLFRGQASRPYNNAGIYTWPDHPRGWWGWSIRSRARDLDRPVQ